MRTSYKYSEFQKMKQQYPKILGLIKKVRGKYYISTNFIMDYGAHGIGAIIASRKKPKIHIDWEEFNEWFDGIHFLRGVEDMTIKEFKKGYIRANLINKKENE